MAQAQGATPSARPEPRTPRIFPDYTSTIIPANIAPLNFRIEEPGLRQKVKIHAREGRAIFLSTRTGVVDIPLMPWTELLRANAGKPLFIDIEVEDDQGQWHAFHTITNTIASQPIDGQLAYRLLKPVYHLFGSLGIYRRNLQTFAETPILLNRSINGCCLNCHSFLNHQSDAFALHIRTETKLRPMLLVVSNEVTRVDKPMGYLSWHPSGQILAFSANKISQFYHTIGESRDLFDAESNLCIYQIGSNQVVTPPAIAQTNWNETWPAWSPDGRYLYFCRALKTPIELHRQVKYDLVRARFDITSYRWEAPETLVSSKDTGLSASQPRISPNGRWLLFCLSQYGNFPVWQPTSDLYVMDLNTRLFHRLEINSDQADSWHCWSSNSRWVVFSSKRLDGLFARPFISYVDEQGTFHKPWLLPQKDPSYYDACLWTFNLPELLQHPPATTPSDLARAFNKPTKILKPQVDVIQEHREQ